MRDDIEKKRVTIAFSILFTVVSLVGAQHAAAAIAMFPPMQLA